MRGVTVTYEDRDAGGTQRLSAQLVRVHHPAGDPEPDRDDCRRADGGGDRRRALRARGQDRAAVQAPLLGRGRGDLRRHHLYRPADPQHRLSLHRLRQPRARACCSGAYAIFNTYAFEFGRVAAGRARRARRSNGAPRSTRNTTTSSRPAWPWHGSAIPPPWAASPIGPTRCAQKHYADLCAIDGRIVLAGEHASYLPAWQEGAVLSSLDAIARLHRRVVAG